MHTVPPLLLNNPKHAADSPPPWARLKAMLHILVMESAETKRLLNSTSVDTNRQLNILANIINCCVKDCLHKSIADDMGVVAIAIRQVNLPTKAQLDALEDKQLDLASKKEDTLQSVNEFPTKHLFPHPWH